MAGSNTYKGKFMPENREKYKGSIDKITYRSSWELFIMKWCDRNTHVVKWNSEEVVIPYFCNAEGKRRRYFMDFWVRFDNGQEFLFEVKPHKETQPPVKPSRMTLKAKERFMRELYTYSVNTDKWKAAQKVCEKHHNMHFRVITEHTLKSVFGWRGGDR